MVTKQRMSPLTALFLGIFGLGAVAVTCASAVALYGLAIVDMKTSDILKFTGDTIEGLPELFESLPAPIGDILNDQRAPSYAAHVDVDVQLASYGKADRVYPVMKVTNTGDEVISMLAVRVASLNADHAPVQTWTEIVATPIALAEDWIDDDSWSGPLMPGGTRFIVPDRHLAIPVELADGLTHEVEISEIRVWQPSDKVASAQPQ